MHKALKHLISFLVFIVILFAVNGFSVFESKAALIGNTAIENQVSAFQEKAGFEKSTNSGQSLASVVATLIKVFLGLLGIIFIILIIWAGYNWMIAQGKEEQIRKSKDTIKAAIIGLVIIVAAYAITYFVFEQLDKLY